MALSDCSLSRSLFFVVVIVLVVGLKILSSAPPIYMRPVAENERLKAVNVRSEVPAFTPAGQASIASSLHSTQKKDLFHAKRVEMSSVYGDDGPWNALDGDPATHFHTCFPPKVCGNSDSKFEWWRVVTEEYLNLSHIVLMHRRDCCEHRFSNIHIEIGIEDTQGTKTLWISQPRSNPTHANAGTMTFEVPSLGHNVNFAKVMRAQGPVDGIFHLAEVELYLTGSKSPVRFEQPQSHFTADKLWREGQTGFRISFSS